MSEENIYFFKEPDENIKIYRYLNFSNFVSILATRTFYFPSAEELSKSDPFEGIIPKKCIDYFRDEMILNEGHRKNVCISCWHMNERESDAMWKLYSRNNDGVAIQSTFKRLKESFNKSKNHIDYSEVKYIDHEKWDCKKISYIIPYFLKNEAFEHEHELRAITYKKENYIVETINKIFSENFLNLFREKVVDLINDIYLDKTDDVEKKQKEIRDIITALKLNKVIQSSEIEILHEILIPSEIANDKFCVDGIYIKGVDIDNLIENIYISPGAKPWFIDLVKSTLEKYKINPEIIKRSKLATLPKI